MALARRSTKEQHAKVSGPHILELLAQKEHIIEIDSQSEEECPSPTPKKHHKRKEKPKKLSKKATVEDCPESSNEAEIGNAPTKTDFGEEVVQVSTQNPTDFGEPCVTQGMRAVNPDVQRFLADRCTISENLGSAQGEDFLQGRGFQRRDIKTLEKHCTTIAKFLRSKRATSPNKKSATNSIDNFGQFSVF
jgi:hypothetical protein